MVQLRVLEVTCGRVTRGQPNLPWAGRAWVRPSGRQLGRFCVSSELCLFCCCLIIQSHWVWIRRVTIAGWCQQDATNMLSKFRAHMAHQKMPAFEIYQQHLQGKADASVFREKNWEGNELSTFPPHQQSTEDQSDEKCLYFPDTLSSLSDGCIIRLLLPISTWFCFNDSWWTRSKASRTPCSLRI